jgi:predicted DNA-binding antitoxin AbrB/MazE fold protein
MTTTVEAVYQGGVFKPVRPVDLPENQLVQLGIEPMREPASDYIAEARVWLEGMRQARQELFDKYGMFTDSTELIREDRKRDI